MIDGIDSEQGRQAIAIYRASLALIAAVRHGTYETDAPTIIGDLSAAEITRNLAATVLDLVAIFGHDPDQWLKDQGIAAATLEATGDLPP